MTLVDLFDVLRFAGFALAVIAIGLYLAMTAGRLDRLHVRYDAALASLELQFALRAEAIAEALGEGYVDPVSSQLMTRALLVRRSGASINVAAESELSAQIGRAHV